jgi:hypothetical protein
MKTAAGSATVAVAGGTVKIADSHTLRQGGLPAANNQFKKSGDRPFFSIT